MKFAVVQTGGKQYKVSEGSSLKVEKLAIPEGQIVTFDKVLLTYDEAGGLSVGKPFLEGVAIKAKIVQHAKGPKIIIFKYKAKKRERKKTGHRQPFTAVTISGMGGQKEEKPKAASKKAAVTKKTRA